MQIAANVPIIVVCIWQAYRIDYYNYLIGASAYSLILDMWSGERRGVGTHSWEIMEICVQSSVRSILQFNFRSFVFVKL